jgi:hypothetical protein
MHLVNPRQFVAMETRKCIMAVISLTLTKLAYICRDILSRISPGHNHWSSTVHAAWSVKRKAHEVLGRGSRLVKRHFVGETEEKQAFQHNRHPVYKNSMWESSRLATVRLWTRSSGKNRSFTFLDMTRVTLKTTRPTILLLLRVYLLPR